MKTKISMLAFLIAMGLSSFSNAQIKSDTLKQDKVTKSETLKKVKVAKSDSLKVKADKQIKSDSLKIKAEKKVKSDSLKVKADKKIKSDSLKVKADKKIKSDSLKVKADKKIKSDSLKVKADKKIKSDSLKVKADKKIKSDSLKVKADKKIKSDSLKVKKSMPKGVKGTKTTDSLGYFRDAAKINAMNSLVSPNPMTAGTGVISVTEFEATDVLTLSITSSQGNPVASEVMVNGTASVATLEVGLYFYKITNQTGKVVAQGRFLVQ